MSAIKRFHEEVSCVLGAEGSITDYVLLVSDRAATCVHEYGIQKEDRVATNEAFIEFIRVMENQIRSEAIRDEGIPGKKVPID